jgi:hypothetical protein
MLKEIIIMMVVLLSGSAQSTVTAGGGLCPEEFEGRVKEVIEEVGPDRAFSTQKVIFDNEQTIKGEVGEQVLVDILKNGPFEIEAGKEYRVLLRKGKLCWIERI